MKQIQQSWRSFFALRKNGVMKAHEPKAVPLRSVNSYALPVDMQYVSFQRKNKIRLLLERGKPLFLHCHHKAILDKVVDFKHVKRMEICLKQGKIYLLLSYLGLPAAPTEPIQKKYAAIDLGVKRLLSIYVDAEQTGSFMVDGKYFTSFNAEYNRKIAVLRKKSRERTKRD